MFYRNGAMAGELYLNPRSGWSELKIEFLSKKEITKVYFSKKNRKVWQGLRFVYKMTKKDTCLKIKNSFSKAEILPKFHPFTSIFKGLIVKNTRLELNKRILIKTDFSFLLEFWSLEFTIIQSWQLSIEICFLLFILLDKGIHHSLFINYYSLFIIHYSLYIIHYSLFIIHYSLFIIHYSLFIILYSSFNIHYSLFINNLSVCTLWKNAQCMK